jgi:DNA mismatch endonuclease (patch repair protein)
MESQVKRASRPGSKPRIRKASVLAGAAFIDGKRHRGDFMSPETRSAVMARIKGKNTGPERVLGKELVRRGLRWDRHARDVLGRPDFVFRTSRVVVFVDGDFWHGWRLPAWLDKLSAKWAKKITGNRLRDHRVHRSLRRSGWRVLRIWEHQIEQDVTVCVERIVHAVSANWPRRMRDARTWPARAKPGITTIDAYKNTGSLRRRRGK